jgi:predicted Zn-dependent protease
MQVEPDSMIINAVGAWIDFLAGKYDERIQQARNTLGLDPSFERARIYLGMNLGQKGLYPDAIAELQSLPQESTGPFMLAALGYVNARAGEKAKAYGITGDEGSTTKRIFSGHGPRPCLFWARREGPGVRVAAESLRGV